MDSYISNLRVGSPLTFPIAGLSVGSAFLVYGMSAGSLGQVFSSVMVGPAAYYLRKGSHSIVQFLGKETETVDRIAQLAFLLLAITSVTIGSSIAYFEVTNRIGRAAIYGIFRGYCIQFTLSPVLKGVKHSASLYTAGLESSDPRSFFGVDDKIFTLCKKAFEGNQATSPRYFDSEDQDISQEVLQAQKTAWPIISEKRNVETGVLLARIATEVGCVMFSANPIATVAASEVLYTLGTMAYMKYRWYSSDPDACPEKKLEDIMSRVSNPQVAALPSS